MGKQNQGSKKKAKKLAFLERQAKRDKERRREAVLKSSSSTMKEMAEALGVTLGNKMKVVHT